MVTAPSILMLGNDLLLLETRTAVLRRAGYRVEAASDFEKLNPSEPDLLILCHSLPADGRVSILKSAIRGWPAAKRLCITPASGAFEGLTEIFNSFEGPAKLLLMVEKMLLND